MRTASLDLSSQPDKALLVLSPAQSPRSPTFKSLLCCRLELPSSWPGSYTPVQLNCPGLWELPSTSTGRSSSFLQTLGVMLLYFEKDPYSPALQTPDNMSYFLLGAELCTPNSYIEHSYILTLPPAPQNVTFFWLRSPASGILALHPGTEPMPPAAEA